MSGWTPINYYTQTIETGMQPTHAAQGRIIGEDGNRYGIIQMRTPPGSHYPVIYCYDTDTVLFYGASQGYSQCVTKMQADLDTLALSGAPASSNFADINETVAIADTKYFVVMGYYARTGGDQLAFIRYKINAAGAIELVDGLINRCAADFSGHYHVINRFGLINQSLVVDCRIVGSTLYVAGSGQNLVSNGIDTIMLAFPLASFGTASTTVGSYEACVTILAHDAQFLNPFSPGYANGQRGCIVSVSGNVGLLAYTGFGQITGSGNKFWSGGTEYNGNPRLIFAYNSLAYTDYGATYGVPFSDAMHNLDGSSSSNTDQSDYSGPSYTSYGGKEYLIFTRSYNGNIDQMRMKIFRWGDRTDLAVDFTGPFWDGATFPATPTEFAPVDVFFSPDGNGHLILQSDGTGTATAGPWRLYADWGAISGQTSRTGIWGAFAPR